LIAVAVGVAIAGAVYLTSSNVAESKNNETTETIDKVKYEVNENGDKQWADADALVPSQFFEVNGAEDKIVETQEGIVVAIPEGAFLDENGNPVSGNIEVEIKEAITPEQIMLSGLTTQSGDDLLETGGMFYINARKNGKSLQLNPDNPIVMDVPTDEVDGSMELYQGVRKDNGAIDWQNPKPMEQFLTPVDIYSLDFYPPNYEQTLIALGEGGHNKEWKDSVYYSFGGRKIERIDKVLFKEEVVVVSDTDYKLYNSISADYTASNESAVGMDTVYHSWQINPSKIQAIWNDKFQNTLIATKEFEERIEVLHHLSTDAYLDWYVNNTDKRLSELDSMMVDNLGGFSYGKNVKGSSSASVNSLFIMQMSANLELNQPDLTCLTCDNCNIDKIREKFIAFAAQGKGRVKMDKGAAKMLKAYYDDRAKVFAKVATKAKKKLIGKYQIAYDDLKRANSDNYAKNINYIRENFKKELKINTEEAYRQAGIKIRKFAKRKYRIQAPFRGWNNIDKVIFSGKVGRSIQDKIWEGTITRTTINVGLNGKMAEIQYLPVSFKIENESDYDRVLVYLLPEELDSYQRVMKSEGGFTEKLNEFFKYKAVVVGFKGQDIYMGREYTVTTGDYTLSLVKSTKQQFKQAITDYGRSKKMKNLLVDVTEKLSMMFQEGEINKMEDNFKFREALAAKIFECFDKMPRGFAVSE
jgi:hypothetical protein